MSHIAISIQGQVLTATPDEPLVARSVGEVTFEVDFDASWDGYAITIIFATAYAKKSRLYVGGDMEVPWEVLDRPGYLWISAVGRAPGKRRPTAIMRQPLTITTNGHIEGGPPAEYSPALWEQVMARLDDVGTGGGGSSAGAEAAQAKAEAAQKKAEAAQVAAEAAAQAAEASNQAAAQEATKAAGEAGNAAQLAGAAAEAQRAAQDAQGKAEAAKQAAEAAKNAAVAAMESIPVPEPTGADEGKVLVARGRAYQLEEIAVGGGGEAEIIADATLQEAAAYTWQGTGAADRYRKIIIDIACLAQEANVNTANATIWGNSIATYYINAAAKDNRKTTIELEIINSNTAIFRRSCMGTRTDDPMAPTTYIAVTDQLIATSTIDASKPLLRIPAELPVGTRSRILGVKA